MRISSSRSAFTLIELLVVIAIIGLLAAILFPVFGRARENARRSSCLSNTRQIGIGIQQYIGDYDETFPLWSFPTPDGSKTYGWASAVMPYIKNTQVFVCPSATIVAPAGTTDNRCNPRYVNSTFANVSTGGAGSYGYNYATLGKYTVTAGVYAAETHRISELGKASERVLTTEVNATIGNQPGSTYYPTMWATVPTNVCSSSGAYSYGDNVADWHFDGVVVGFADGHSKWMRISVLRDKDGNGTVDNGWYDILSAL